jgi:hypothetical protein
MPASFVSHSAFCIPHSAFIFHPSSFLVPLCATIHPFLRSVRRLLPPLGYAGSFLHFVPPCLRAFAPPCLRASIPLVAATPRCVLILLCVSISVSAVIAHPSASIPHSAFKHLRILPSPINYQPTTINCSGTHPDPTGHLLDTQRTSFFSQSAPAKTTATHYR